MRHAPLHLAAFVLLLLAAPTLKAKDCRYHVEGTLEVDHKVAPMDAQWGTSPLEDVRVRLAGRRKVLGIWGWWKPWQNVRTGPNGHFSIDVRKNCAQRQLRLRVRFRSSELEVRQGKATQPLTKKVKWYDVWRSGKTNSSILQINQTYAFASGGSRALGREEPREHAEIWALYSRVADTLEQEYGSTLGFEDKIKVKHPHSLSADRTSYANPLNDVIYLVSNSAPQPDCPGVTNAGECTETMLHELMHIWAYQHSRLENRMAYYLVGHIKEGTHGVVDRSFVGFHEGFAEYAKDILMRDLFGQSLDRPLSPAGMASAGMGIGMRADRSDFGWHNMFNLLGRPTPWEYNFETSSRRLSRGSVPLLGVRECHTPQITFQELLQVFERPGPDIHAREMDFFGFFDRLEKAYPEVERGGRAGGQSGPAQTAYMAMLSDLFSASERYSRMCEGYGFVTLPPLPEHH